MSSQRSRANKSIGNKLNNLDTQVKRAAGTKVIPAENTVGEAAIQPNSIGPGAVQPGAVDSAGLGRGAVGTENMGVVSAITSDGDLTLTVPGSIMVQASTVGPATQLLPTGMVIPFAGYTYSFPEPYGWLLCDGSAVSRTDYAALFACIGTVYGVGNGTTTFNVPNLLNRIPFGAGTNTKNFPNDQAGTPGTTGGDMQHTISASELPAHTHDIDSGTTKTTATAGASGASPDNGGFSTTQGSTVGRFTQVIRVTGSTTSTGGGIAHDIMPPYVAMHYLIRAL